MVASLHRLRVAISIAGIMAGNPLSADTFNVTSASDGGSPGTLRWAILQANATPGGDTINLGSGTITLQSALPDLGGTVLIQGAGQALTVVQSAPTRQAPGVNWRVFSVPAGANATLRDLTARHGVCEVTGAGTATGGGIHNAGTLTLERVTLFANTALNPDVQPIGNEARGGGVGNLGTLTIRNCTIRENVAMAGEGSPTGGVARGGGIHCGPASVLTLLNSTIDTNEAKGGSGGPGPAQGGNGEGGGLFAETGAIVLVRNCTISNNRAMEGFPPLGAPGLGLGGGIHAKPGADHAVSILMSTISGNMAGSTAGQGGGIRGGPGLTVDSCTITANLTPTDGGGGGIATTTTAPPAGPLVRNTIISGNIAGISSDDLAGRINGRGHLLVSALAPGAGIDTSSPGNTATGNISAPDAMLGPLANNGGPTSTHALLPSSPAINAGTDTFILLGTGPTDQRGQPRVWIQADIGSFEVQGPPSSVDAFDAYE